MWPKNKKEMLNGTNAEKSVTMYVVVEILTGTQEE